MFICSPFVSRLFLLFRTVEDACPYNHFGIVCLFFFLFSLLIGIAYIEPRHYGGGFVLQKGAVTSDSPNILFIPKLSLTRGDHRRACAKCLEYLVLLLDKSSRYYGYPYGAADLFYRLIRYCGHKLYHISA